MLEYEFELGIKVLAHVHAGDISFSCSNCNDGQKKALGCNEEVAVPIINDLGEWYRCPLKFISSAVYSWYDEYSYYDHFKCAPPYWSISARFWEACKVYISTYNRLINEKQEKSKSKHSEATTADSLAKMKAMHRRKKKNKR